MVIAIQELKAECFGSTQEGGVKKILRGDKYLKIVSEGQMRVKKANEKEVRVEAQIIVHFNREFPMNSEIC